MEREGANPSSHGTTTRVSRQDYWAGAFSNPHGIGRPKAPRSRQHPSLCPNPGVRWPQAEAPEGVQASLGDGVGRTGCVDGFLTPHKYHFEATTVFLEHKQYSKAETFICSWETFIP